MNALKYFREYRSLTVRQFGQMLGVTGAMVVAWEHGRARIHPKHYDKIIEILKINPNTFHTEILRDTPLPKRDISSSSTVLDRLAEEMKAAAVRNAEMRWSRYIADIREITERHFRRFDEQERERVFAEISTHPDRPPAVAVEYMARRIIEQMVPAAAAETKEATE